MSDPDDRNTIIYVATLLMQRSIFIYNVLNCFTFLGKRKMIRHVFCMPANPLLGFPHLTHSWEQAMSGQASSLAYFWCRANGFVYITYVYALHNMLLGQLSLLV